MTTTWFAIGLVALSTLLSGIAPILLKIGAKNFTINPKKLLKKPSLLLKNYGVFGGIASDGTSAIMNVIALRFGELSVLYPVNSLTYIWACLFSVKFLGEQMNKQKWYAIILIVIGVVLVTIGKT